MRDKQFKNDLISLFIKKQDKIKEEKFSSKQDKI
jgi:hypothetical protein